MVSNSSLTPKHLDIFYLFKEIGGNISSRAKEKLIYKMLNSIKTGDRKEFTWLAFRTLASSLSAPQKESSLKKLQNLNYISASDFEAIAYSAIAGLISSSSGGGAENE